jgi:single-strand DNA-binding protein
MNLNQHTIIGFIGKNAEAKYLPNGAPVVKFSVATKKSWKDDAGEWQEKTQWHNIVAFAKGFENMVGRLQKGTHVFVQGELCPREYDKTIGNGKKSTVVKRLAVETIADTIRTLDRNGNAQQNDAAEPPVDEDEASAYD